MFGLLTCLTTEITGYSQKAKCAVFCFKKLATYRFLAAIFLRDSLELLSYLCKSLQRDDLQYPDATVKLEATVASLLALKESDGTSLSKFMKQLPDKPPGSGKTMFFDHEITDTVTQRQSAEEIKG